ncbi:MAG TPA: uridine kinase [Anaerolineales bacterium]|nr:uridine kinase [Anaerolineales bacterium]HLE73316.1 uridine kinase [Anaerolineales bacterium]
MPSPAPTPLVIGIAGGSGSGKTTVSQSILQRADPDLVAYIQHDSYYKDLSALPPAQRATTNFDHPNSLETDLMVAHVRQLRAGKAIEVPTYNFTTHTRQKDTQHVEPRPIILVEGILLFTDTRMRGLCDLKLFVDTDADLRFIRRLQRDIQERGRTTESVILQYQATVRPMHLEFVEPSKRYADLIIPEGGYNQVAMDVFMARIEAKLREFKTQSRKETTHG